MKLKTRIILLFLVIGLMPLLIISYINYGSTRRTLEGEISHRLQSISLIQKNRLKLIFQKNLELVTLCASRPSLIEPLKEYNATKNSQLLAPLKHSLVIAINAVPEFESGFLLDTEGNVILSTDSLDLPIPRETLWNIDIRQPQGNFFFLNKQERLTQLFTAPIFRDNSMIGLLAITYDAKDITETVNDYTGLGKTGETVLGILDQEGNALFVTQLRKDPKAALKRKILSQEKAPINITLENKKEIYVKGEDYMKDEVFASTRYIHETGWGIVTKINTEEALKSLDVIARMIISLTFLAFAIIIGLALYFSKTLTDPIIELTSAARNILRGIPQEQVVVDSKNEIGVLADAFNLMVAKHNFVNSAGETLSESLDIKAVITKVSSLIVPALADWFTIDLVENGELQTIAITHRDPLKVQFAHELRKRYPRSLNDNGAVSKVIRTGAPEFYKIISLEMIRAAAKDDEHYKLLTELGFNSGLVVPLKIKGSTVGAITLITSKDSGRFYTDFDLNVAEDLARRISVTLENARLFEESKILNEKKDEFMNIASHELKTPLSTAKAYIQLAERDVAGRISDTTVNYLRKGNMAIGKLQSLIAELLDVSRIQAGKLQFHAQEFDPDVLLNEVLENIRNSEPSHQIIKHGEVHRPVHADRDRIEQVIINLLTNAVKYSPGMEKVDVFISEAGDALRISVKDYGIGIPEKNLSKIFDRYYRVETGGVRFQGLGIGLYISYEIIKRHNGKMWVESSEGSGSTFHFELPFNSGSEKQI